MHAAGEHILHSLSMPLWKMDEHDAVAADGHLRSVSSFSIISLHFPLICTTTCVTKGLDSHRDDNLPSKTISPSRVLFFTPAAPPHGEVRCNLQIRRGWMNVHLCRPEVTTHVTTPGEGLWEGGQLAALTRLQGARCHIPGALGLPLEPSATDPSDGMCGSASPRRCEGVL